MKVLGGFLLFIGIIDILAMLATGTVSLPLFVGALVFCLIGASCLPERRTDGASNSNSGNASGSNTDGVFEGHTHGEIIDLGSGQYFDSHDPNAVTDGVNWHSDGQGGYYNSGTGETIGYNNGAYSYYDSNDDES